MNYFCLFKFILIAVSFSEKVPYSINVFQFSPKSNDLLFINETKKCLGNLPNKTYLPTNTKHAKLHYEKINKEIKKFLTLKRPSYNTCDGPFLENEFIKRYKDKPLSYFSPFIPLFVPWFTIWKLDERRYKSKIQQVLNILDPDYLYFVLSESDFGFTGHKHFASHLPPNVLVFSASGMGHVAVPWIQCNVQPIKKSYSSLFSSSSSASIFSTFQSSNSNDKHYFISFCGNPRSSGERKETLEMTRAIFGSNFYECRKNDWEEVITNSVFALSPRGIAVATYRTFEIIRMESAIQIILTDYVHWLPYFPKLNWSSFSILTNVQEFARTSLRLRKMKEFEFAQLKKEMHRVNFEFFQWKGFFKQLDNFFEGKDHYFSCSKAFLTYPQHKFN